MIEGEVLVGEVEAGFQVGSGVMAGLPGQTAESIEVWAAGADARVRLAALDLVAEILWGQSGRGLRTPEALGGTLYGQWRMKLSETVRVRPLLKLELVDQDLRRNHDLSWAVLAGLNIHLGEYLRLMIQAQRLEAQAQSRLPEAWRGVLQLALDGKWDLVGGDPPEVR